MEAVGWGDVVKGRQRCVVFMVQGHRCGWSTREQMAMGGAVGKHRGPRLHGEGWDSWICRGHGWGGVRLEWAAPPGAQVTPLSLGQA